MTNPNEHEHPGSRHATRHIVAVLLVTVAAGAWTGCQNQPAEKSTAPAAASQTPAAPAAEKTAEADTIDHSKFNDYGELIRSGADFPVTTAFARDTRTFKIAPLDGVEFNYRMEKGGTMVYSWTASDFVVWDFHGEPKGSNPATPKVTRWARARTATADSSRRRQVSMAGSGRTRAASR